MKNLIFILSILTTVNLLASPSGTYYSAYETSPDGHYSPEQLHIFTDTSLTVLTVHDGAKLVEVTPIQVQGNKIIASASAYPETVWSCNGLETIYEASESFTYEGTYTKNSKVLSIQVDGMELKLTNATPEQIAKIQSLPNCIKK